MGNPSAKRIISIQESREYFQSREISTRSGFSVNQYDWAGLVPAWSAANSVQLNDSNTVVIVPIADSATMVNPYLDAYILFFRDSLDAAQMHVLFFQADTSHYIQDSFPTIQNFSGLIWEFYDEQDTYGVTVVQGGEINGCGCSATFGTYVDTLTGYSLRPRTSIVKCPKWKESIWEWFGGVSERLWNSLGEFFGNIFKNGNGGSISGKNGSNGNGGSGGNGGWGSNGGSDLDGFGGFGFGGIGGNSSGGGSNVILNLSSIFSEWELKNMLKAADWMNDTYALNWDINDLFILMDLECIWEVSDFIQHPGGLAIGEEQEGPACALAYLLGTQLNLSDSEIECIQSNSELMNEIYQFENFGLLKDVCNSNNQREDILRNAIQMSCNGDQAVTRSEFFEKMNTMDYVYMDQSFLNCGILACVYNTLKSTNDNLFCGSIDNFANDPLTRLTLSIGKPSDFPNPNERAKTDGTSAPNNIKIIFNPALCDDDYLQSIELAETMLHEAIHAKMFYDCWPENGSKENYFIGFPECALLYYGDQEAGQSTEHQHQTMLNAFVQVIAESLDSFSGGAGTWQDWEWLVLRGLAQYSPCSQESWFQEKLINAYANYQDNTFNIVYPCQ